MSKTLAWIFGIVAVLAVGGVVVFAILWNKEKKKGEEAKKKTNGGGTAAAAATTAAATVAQIAEAATNPQTGTGTVARFSN